MRPGELVAGVLRMEAWRGSMMACLALATVVLTDAEDLATYDQRQTGELNVHVHVKNVSVVAFLDGAYGVSELLRTQYAHPVQTPRELVRGFKRFGGTCCLHLQG